MNPNTKKSKQIRIKRVNHHNPQKPNKHNEANSNIQKEEQLIVRLTVLYETKTQGIRRLHL